MTNKALIIGCGKIAGIFSDDPESHAYAYSNHKSFNLISCFDIDNEKTNIFSKNYGCIGSESLDEALSKYHPDIISVCTPDETHYDVILELLNHENLPKLIFLEKPALSNSFQLDTILQMSEQRDVAIVVNHSRRFDTKHVLLRDKIILKEFGDLVNCSIDYYGGWIHNGVHVVDTLSFLFNDEIIVQEITGSMDSGYPNDPTLDVTMSFKNNPGKINLKGFDERYYQIFEFDFKFEKGRVKVSDFGNKFSYEQKVINKKNENVLESISISSIDDQLPIMNAAQLMSQYLELRDIEILRGYMLNDIASTMYTLWRGVE